MINVRPAEARHYAIGVNGLRVRAIFVGVAAIAALVTAIGSLTLNAQNSLVTSDRILKAASEPANWLTYNGTYNSQRYSTLAQITPRPFPRATTR